MKNKTCIYCGASGGGFNGLSCTVCEGLLTRFRRDGYSTEEAKERLSYGVDKKI